MNSLTPDSWQSKMLIISTNIDQKIVINRDFDCQNGDKWLSKTLFLAIFDPRSSIVKSIFDCRPSGVILNCDDMYNRRKCSY